MARLLVTGSPQSGKSTLISSLFNFKVPKKLISGPLRSFSIPPHTTWPSPLEITVLQSTQLASVLQPILPKFIIHPTVAMIVLDYHRPWKILSDLKAWSSVLKTLRPAISEIFVVLTQCDLSTRLEDELALTKSHFDYLQYSVRSFVIENLDSTFLFCLHSSDSFLPYLQERLLKSLYSIPFSSSMPVIYDQVHFFLDKGTDTRAKVEQFISSNPLKSALFSSVFPDPNSAVKEPELLIALSESQFLQELISARQSYLEETGMLESDSASEIQSNPNDINPIVTPSKSSLDVVIDKMKTPVASFDNDLDSNPTHSDITSSTSTRLLNLPEIDTFEPLSPSIKSSHASLAPDSFFQNLMEE